MGQFHFTDRARPRRTLRAAAWGAGGLGLAAVAAFVAMASDHRADAEEMARVVERAEAQREIARSGIGTLGADLFYEGETAQLAQAGLQTDLQAVAEAHDVAVEMVRADEVEQVDGLTRLNLSLTAVVPEARLGGFLQALAAHEPMLVVEDLSLRRARPSRATGNARSVAAQMTLYGVVRR